MLRASDLDQKVTILALIEEPSPRGGAKSEWRIMPPRRWAQVMEGASKDFVAGSAQGEQKRVSFRLRWDSALAAKGANLRVEWNGAVYEVTGTTGTRRNAELRLQCVSVAKAA